MLERYNVTTGTGYRTTLRLTPEGAARRGLTEDDKVANTARGTESGAPQVPAGDAITTATTDLSKYKVGDVVAYLEAETTSPEERARIIELESGATKPRTTITEWKPAQ